VKTGLHFNQGVPIVVEWELNRIKGKKRKHGADEYRKLGERNFRGKKKTSEGTKILVEKLVVSLQS